VIEGFTGRRIATRLLGVLVAHPACRDAATILLEVSKHSTEAVSLYGRFGFRAAEERGDRILMRYERKPGDAQVPEGPEQ
jgi:ribosomal protein S18 acetylase RimI-like enzyme